MKKKGFTFKMLTLTILSDDANGGVKRLRFPRLIILLLCLLLIIPIVSLAYFIHMSDSQQHEIQQLDHLLTEQTSETIELQSELNEMSQKMSEAEEKLLELHDLEIQMREYLDEFSASMEPTGGPIISLSNEDHQEPTILKETSTDLVDRYKNTISIVDEVNEQLKYIPTIWPTIPNKITSEFGKREDPFTRTSSFHNGVDIRGDFGVPVYATADGTVILSEYYNAYGNSVQIRHGEDYQTMYSHMSELLVEVGDEVKKGDIIGKVGSTGRSTGPHLHYEIQKEGEPIDPMIYLNLDSSTINED